MASLVSLKSPMRAVPHRASLVTALVALNTAKPTVHDSIAPNTTGDLTTAHSAQVVKNSPLNTLRPPSASEASLGIACASILALGAHMVAKQKDVRGKITRNMAHPFSWAGWMLDSGIAVITLSATQSWGLALLRLTAGMICAQSLYFAMKEESKNQKNLFKTFSEFLLKKEERANVVCLASSVTASVIVAATKLFGGELQGAQFHTIAALGLFGFGATAIPTLKSLIKDLQTPLPKVHVDPFFKFCRKNFAAASWTAASVLSMPLALGASSSWSTWGWVILPVILNPILLWNYRRKAIREQAANSTVLG
jgi:hypothetical protein